MGVNLEDDSIFTSKIILAYTNKSIKIISNILILKYSLELAGNIIGISMKSISKYIIFQ